IFSLFFQAEDGIRYDLVTGVQTCALPIYNPRFPAIGANPARGSHRFPAIGPIGDHRGMTKLMTMREAVESFVPDGSSVVMGACRSEERRVGKESGSRGEDEEGWKGDV